MLQGTEPLADPCLGTVRAGGTGKRFLGAHANSRVVSSLASWHSRRPLRTSPLPPATLTLANRKFAKCVTRAPHDKRKGTFPFFTQEVERRAAEKGNVPFSDSANVRGGSHTAQVVCRSEKMCTSGRARGDARKGRLECQVAKLGEPAPLGM